MALPQNRISSVAALGGGGGGGGGGWTPATPGSAVVKAWYQFDLLSGSDTDPIATFADSSGNGNVPTTQTGTLRATLAAAHQKSKNTLRFTYTAGQFYQLPNILSGVSAASIYIVFKRLADPGGITDSGLFGFGTGGLPTHWPYSDGNIYDDFASNARKAVGNPTPSLASTYRIVGVHSAASDYGVYIDGTSFYSTGTNTVAPDSTPKLGTEDSLTGYMSGWIAEVIITNAKQSGSDREKFEGYLAHKWGLTANLDSGHPYKTTPP